MMSRDRLVVVTSKTIALSRCPMMRYTVTRVGEKNLWSMLRWATINYLSTSRCRSETDPRKSRFFHSLSERLAEGGRPLHPGRRNISRRDHGRSLDRSISTLPLLSKPGRGGMDDCELSYLVCFTRPWQAPCWSRWDSEPSTARHLQSCSSPTRLDQVETPGLATG